jgi:hypothetical protein
MELPVSLLDAKFAFNVRYKCKKFHQWYICRLGNYFWLVPVNVDSFGARKTFLHVYAVKPNSAVGRNGDS